MSARKSASGAGKMKSTRDKARAAFMAKHGVKRTTMRDPITNKMVAINGYRPGKFNGD